MTAAKDLHLKVIDPSTGKDWKINVELEKSKATSFAVIPTNPESQSLTVLDNRTAKLYTVPITSSSISASDFRNIKLNQQDSEGIRVYDPAYQNTAVVRSKITFIDGDQGVLRYRGYPIEELAEKSTFLEVAYLLIYGELPNVVQYKAWSDEVMRHTFVHVSLAELMQKFNYDSHPMGSNAVVISSIDYCARMFISGVAAMSTFHAEANPALKGNDLYVKNKKVRNKQYLRILGKIPTVAAMAYRHRIGRPFNLPQSDISYTENFLYMMDNLVDKEYNPNPKLARALDILFILHADHELNNSTATMRQVSSTLVDPYSAVAASAASLYGPLHGGANEAVLKMLEEIGSVDQVPSFIEAVKTKKKKLMGFGHRVYKNFDPRAKLIRKLAYDVFEICGREPLIDVAVELESCALADDYFVQRKLYPNVDFYSGLIYKAMGFPVDFFPVLFAIPRVAGWLAHWTEDLDDPNSKIWRPRQLYVGQGKRTFLPLHLREVKSDASVLSTADHHPFSKRTRSHSKI